VITFLILLAIVLGAFVIAVHQTIKEFDEDRMNDKLDDLTDDLDKKKDDRYYFY